MPTYLQLAAEPEWGAQFTPSAMDAELLAPLRAFYGLGPASIGAAGDNNHLYGRHRSYAWDRNSRYCTDRSYGTTDGRDQGGDRNWYRASDIGITGQRLFDACRRIDALVRAGRAPGIAEWFGTFDGETVVGWFEGHPSSSDDSHLWHLHLGFWNESANDASLMQLVYATITGTEPLEEDMKPFTVREPANGSVWLCDYMTRRGIGSPEEWKRLQGWGISHKGDLPATESIDWYGHLIGGQVTIQLSDEQLATLTAEVEAAAHAGAADAVADLPTADEIRKVVDEQLDQQSLGGADNDSGA